jgi:hypothetical protein
MKHMHFSKRAVAILLSSVLLLIFSACLKDGGVSSVFASSAASSDEPAFSSVEIPLPTQSGTSSAITTSDAPADSGETPSEATLSGISPLSAYQSVLQNKAEFFSTDANKNLKISQLSQAISLEVTAKLFMLGV